MSLLDYFRKRDFKKTAEPKSGKSKTKTLSFVVQRHHASHLHYDFRLELDGVLKSWAVPKGPSMDPNDKRLAMMVEDHPYDYRNFEGVIPQGNYGAGVVLIWDKGTYTSLAENREDDVKTLRAGLKSGNLKFRLKGEILKGEFALVKLHNAEDNSWLLIKHNDEFAQRHFNSEDLVPEKIKALKNNKHGEATTLPLSKKIKTKEKNVEDGEAAIAADNEATAGKPYTPMMAKLAPKVFDSDDWIFERKLDGYRAIGYTGSKARLISRNDIDFSKDYSKIVDELKSVPQKAILDGELVIEDKSGKSSFQDIQQYEGDTRELKLKYYVFDLLNFDGHDLRGMELVRRKELLKSLLKSIDSKDIIYNDHIEGKGTVYLEKAKKEGWEGIIGKDSHSYYNSGKRTDHWLKFKLQNSQEAIICGYTAPEGSRKYFGSLILGIKPGDKMQYIGNCGTGFNEAGIKELYEKMHPLETDKKPFEEKIIRRNKITWIKPKLVCEVWYAEWTADKHLRHPVFKGLRMDKKSEKVIMETPDTQLADEEVITIGRKNLKVTHLNKVFWKEEGITKGQLINYYRDMADWIVPYLKDKPISMRRQPNGTGDPGFFQKDTDTAHLPDFIKTESLYSESNDKHIHYIIGDGAATLLYMVNLGCIEINPWLSSYKTPENPDYIVIDLDPHDVPFSYAVDAALKTKEIFERMKLEVFIKTSGSKGLHIYCYLGAKYDYDFVKMFAEYAANLIHTELPDTTSVERSPAKRKNKVYIDFLQNRRGQTVACPYSVRPRPGATVSAPLKWSEVNYDLKLSDYTIFNMKDRVKKINDPWKELTNTKADLKKALELLKK
ncbi:DNA ligase D [Mucilaginibacter gotjawali]|uniref:DNA ligase (ATP) n=1 Tax=Mucilaginibacter gotjawali TaxID=1550579 RepID=A0A839SEJ9_9SPHI|nr:DNA ligase D [Mucilaginibacter gotjawali]MBB3055069.1 bifunctional non-homologous end joining protein LigD [Mucilaginibacter gotjawali]